MKMAAKIDRQSQHHQIRHGQSKQAGNFSAAQHKLHSKTGEEHRLQGTLPAMLCARLPLYLNKEDY
jgi:hypothetical protein